MKKIEKRRNGFNPYDLLAVSKKLNLLTDQSALRIKILDPYTLSEPDSIGQPSKNITRKSYPDIKIKL